MLFSLHRHRWEAYGVAWFGIRVNTFANSPYCLCFGLKGLAHPHLWPSPCEAGMSIGMLLISVELVIMLGILL